MSIHKRSLLVFLLLAAVIVLGSIYGFYEKDKVTELDEASKLKGSSGEMITVYVCGAVNKPGVVKLSDGARNIDAIEACGGALPTADTVKINMAQLVKDGVQITVPEKNMVLMLENQATSKGEPVKANGVQVKQNNNRVEGKININTANHAELDKLPGVGASTAEAIIEYRQKEGQFQAIEDLKKVNGIGEAKFRKIVDHITI
ncbi:MAG: comEA [Firmicutes bacterium]|nr:comEA [Bacillota bacterium]